MMLHATEVPKRVILAFWPHLRRGDGSEWGGAGESAPRRQGAASGPTLALRLLPLAPMLPLPFLGILKRKAPLLLRVEMPYKMFNKRLTGRCKLPLDGHSVLNCMVQT